jgi:uncharacterized ion transporter superfamily protein YfcC
MMRIGCIFCWRSKINYYFVPVHSQKIEKEKEKRAYHDDDDDYHHHCYHHPSSNDNEDYTPEKSCMMCSFHLCAFVIV